MEKLTLTNLVLFLILYAVNPNIFYQWIWAIIWILYGIAFLCEWILRILENIHPNPIKSDLEKRLSQLEMMTKIK